jgi:hypothetical protein
MFMFCSIMADETASQATTCTDADLGDGAMASARPLAERQIEALGELVGIGLKIARAIERRVDEAGPEAPLADLNAAAIAYARVARAVRQSILLQDRLKAGQDAAAGRAGDLRSRVAGIVRRAIEDEHDDAEQVERLAAEAAERLEQEHDHNVLTRPVREIVAGICKDLGLHPDWMGLAEDIAAAQAFARRDPAAGEPAISGPVDIRWLDDDEPVAGDSS